MAFMRWNKLDGMETGNVKVYSYLRNKGSIAWNGEKEILNEQRSLSAQIIFERFVSIVYRNDLFTYL